MRSLERFLQESCVKWFRYRFPKETIFAPMNEGVRGKVKSRSGRYFRPEGIKAKAMGKLAGVADLFVMKAMQGYYGLFIELKTEKGRQSLSQKEFEQACKKNNYKYLLISDIDDFMAEVEDYMTQGYATWTLLPPQEDQK